MVKQQKKTVLVALKRLKFIEYDLNRSLTASHAAAGANWRELEGPLKYRMKEPFVICSITQQVFVKFILRIFRFIKFYEINSFRLAQLFR